MPENQKSERQEELQENKGRDHVGFFDVDHPFNRMMGNLGTYILANILFIVGCIPIVTVGVSFSALNKVMYEFAKHDDIRVSTIFFQAYKENFVNGLIGLILGMAFLTMGGVGLVYCLHLSSLVTMFFGFVILGTVTFVALCFLTFYFGIIAQYENDLIGHLKNGVIVGTAYVRWGVLIWLLWIIPIGVCYLFPEIFLYFGFIWVLIGFAFLVNITTKIYRRVFMLISGRELTDTY